MIKRLLSTFALLLCLSSFLGCTSKKETPPEAGVILTFDDAYVNEWYRANQVLKKYDWKATFNICRIDSIGEPQQRMLHQLQNEGHEIAGHGYNHYNAVKFVDQNGMNAYLQQEIDPMMAAMKRRKFNVTTFTYPYGERSDALDSTLTKRFRIIRGRAFCGDQPEKEGCYFRGTKFMYAFDIDKSHKHFSYHYLLELLDYAKKNNKILVLCGHNVVNNVTGNYQTQLETLEFVCKYMKINNMKFYTLRDMEGFVK
jgi:peptidoglycan/xylan/chitin deacetylase (PgdA/CDA1 family)